MRRVLRGYSPGWRSVGRVLSGYPLPGWRSVGRILSGYHPPSQDGGAWEEYWVATPSPWWRPVGRVFSGYTARMEVHGESIEWLPSTRRFMGRVLSGYPAQGGPCEEYWVATSSEYRSVASVLSGCRPPQDGAPWEDYWEATPLGLRSLGSVLSGYPPPIMEVCQKSIECPPGWMSVGRVLRLWVLYVLPWIGKVSIFWNPSILAILSVITSRFAATNIGTKCVEATNVGITTKKIRPSVVNIMGTKGLYALCFFLWMSDIDSSMLCFKSLNWLIHMPPINLSP